jgi:DNA-binding NarL/FixJ family response regulator
MSDEHGDRAVIRVLLADDHPVVRSGIRTLLEATGRIEIAGEAETGAQALDLVERIQPDILLLDMEMPGMSGLEVARRLAASGSGVRLLALSAHDDEAYIMGLLAAGAAGYLTKDEAPRTIVDAVVGIARGEDGWMSRRVMARVTRRHVVQATSPVSTLSLRERQVLRLMANGHSNDEIATHLAISDGTVRNHVTNLYTKLDVRTRAEAVAWAWQHGLMTS